MCKEDVRIGRKKTVLRGVQGVSGANGGRVLGMNPNRATAMVSLVGYDTAEPFTLVVILSGGIEGPVIGMVSATAPHWRATVEELGDAVTGEIYTLQELGTDPTVAASEVQWTEALADL